MTGSFEQFDPYQAWLGIGPQERPATFYRLLGLADFESNPQIIEAAVERRLSVLRAHMGGPYSAHAEQLIGKVAYARLTLLDPARKLAYDMSLRQQMGLPTTHVGQSSATRKSAWSAPTVGSFPAASQQTFGRQKKQGLKPEVIAGLVVAGLAVAISLGLLVLHGLRKRERALEQANRLNVPHVAQRENVRHPPAAEDQPPVAAAGAEAPPDGEAADHRAGAGKGATPPEAGRPLEGFAQRPEALPPAGNFPGAPPAVIPAQAEKITWLRKVQEATVVIEGASGQGSGFFVANRIGKLFLVTNAHVVMNNWSLRVKLSSGQVIPLQRGQILPEFDLAILDVVGFGLPQPLELRADLPDVGEKVFAYGAPRELEGSLSEGIVSAIRTTQQIRDAVGDNSFDEPVPKAQTNWIQTTAPVSPGNSGGPLVDAQGRVVGITTASFNPRLAQNLNFALAAGEILERINNPRVAFLPQQPPAPKVPEFPQVPDLGPRPADGLAGFGGLPMVTRPLYAFEVYDCPDIVLPTGEVFQAGKVRPPKNWYGLITMEAAITYRERKFTINLQSKFPFYTCYDDNDRLQFAAAYSKGLLHGPAVLFNEGNPYAMANYHQGSRNGPLVVYDAQGHPFLLVEFTRNRKQGLVCVFADKEPFWPRYIEHWRANQLVASCLINWESEKPAPQLVKSLTDAGELNTAQQLAAHVEGELGKIEALETAVRLEVLEVFRQVDQAIKKDRAAQLGAQATAAILARHAAREAAGAAVRAEANARFSSGLGPPRP